MLAAISAGFTLGLGVSGSCAVMCMPVLASYVASSEKPTFASGLFTSLLFSLGRLISYTVLAIIFGLIASAFDISQTVKGIAVLILGCLVIIQGLSALGVLNAKIPLGLSLCKYTRNRNSPVILGMLTGLNPCVTLIAALTYSVTLSAVGESVVFMLFFWLGASLLLMAVGVISGGVAQVAGKTLSLERVRRISGIAMVVVGLFFLAQGIGYLL